MGRSSRRSLSLGAVMIGVALAALAFAIGRSLEAPPKIQALAGALIAVQYVVLFGIIALSRPAPPEE